MADPNLLKQIKIKTWVVNRYYKDIISYQKEEAKLQEKMKTLEDQKSSPSEMKQPLSALEETKKMIPECQKQFTQAYGELSALIVYFIRLRLLKILQTRKQKNSMTRLIY